MTAKPNSQPAANKKSKLENKANDTNTDSLSLKQIILQVAHQIPEGKVATYGQIAELAGIPRAARLAGNALKSLPPKSTIPWHRVVNSQGKISLPESNPSHQKQRQRLKAEGVFMKNSRINLSEYRWIP